MASTNKKQDDNKAQFPDPVAMGQALMEAYQQAIPLYQEFLNKNYTHDLKEAQYNGLDLSQSYMDLIQDMTSNPQKFWDMQMGFWRDWTNLWQESSRRFIGDNIEAAENNLKAPKSDRRFKAPEWQESAVFDFIKQSYLLTCDWMQKTIQGAEGLTPEERKKLEFYTQLYANALSPSNFVLTNPEVLKETLNTGGENLVKGFKNLIQDLERGHGDLKISTTDYNAFELGKNIACTPGRVIYQNDLMQLIQYTPTTEKVYKTPLLIIPPWINKYYILDLREDNSLIKWLVDQGHTVFTISWVNPDSSMADKLFDDYMQDGVLAAMDQIESITGEKQCNTLGYCLGGTLLTMTLSYLTTKKQADRIASATFLTTLVDFEEAGDMKIFMDDEQLDILDQIMSDTGILEGKHLQKTFSLLRANDLIWSFVVNNYLMGREPFPFDLLYWNDDATNMPAAMHSFYLRKLYRDNLLAKSGGIEICDTPIDVTKIKTPSYMLSAREDHIAPWLATYKTSQLLGGPKVFTLAASGHIAGVINAPEKNKYCYWTSDKTPPDCDTWFDGAKEQKGSWWPHWEKWLRDFAGTKVKARKPAKGIEPAPGSYVRMKG